MQHGNAYDFAISHIMRERLIALFPGGEGLCYVTWGHPPHGGIVHRAAYSADAHRRALAAVALIKVARGIHSEVEA